MCKAKIQNKEQLILFSYLEFKIIFQLWVIELSVGPSDYPQNHIYERIAKLITSNVDDESIFFFSE